MRLYLAPPPPPPLADRLGRSCSGPRHDLTTTRAPPPFPLSSLSPPLSPPTCHGETDATWKPPLPSSLRCSTLYGRLDRKLFWLIRLIRFRAVLGGCWRAGPADGVARLARQGADADAVVLALDELVRHAKGMERARLEGEMRAAEQLHDAQARISWQVAFAACARRVPVRLRYRAGSQCASTASRRVSPSTPRTADVPSKLFARGPYGARLYGPMVRRFRMCQRRSAEAAGSSTPASAGG